MQGSISIRVLLSLALLVITMIALSFVKAILWPFVLALVLAYILDPVTQRLERIGFSRSMSGLFISLSFVVLISGFIAVLLPLFVSQFIEVTKLLPNAIDVLELKLKGYGIIIPSIVGIRDTLITTIKGSIGNNTSIVIDKLSGIANNAFLLVLVPIMLCYLLKDWDNLRNVVLKIFPLNSRVKTAEWMTGIDASVAGFLRGQLTVMIILGTWYCIVLSIIGLDYSIAIGVLTGILIFIPYVGAFLGVFVATLVGLVQFGDWHIFLIWGVYGFAQTVESFILTPNIVGSKVGLHPVWMMFALMGGGLLFGFIGVLLAVPTTAAIGSTIRFGFKQYTQSDFYRAR